MVYITIVFTKVCVNFFLVMTSVFDMINLVNNKMSYKVKLSLIKQDYSQGTYNINISCESKLDPH
jgi:hypothetical protein